MIKPFIEIRKRTWLPIKFRLKRKKLIDEIELRSPEEIYDRIKETETLLVKAETGRDINEQAMYRTVLKTLKWITLNK